MATILPLDFKEFLLLLNSHGVDYLLIGGKSQWLRTPALLELVRAGELALQLIGDMRDFMHHQQDFFGLRRRQQLAGDNEDHLVRDGHAAEERLAIGLKQQPWIDSLRRAYRRHNATMGVYNVSFFLRILTYFLGRTKLAHYPIRCMLLGVGASRIRAANHELRQRLGQQYTRRHE